MAAVPDCNDINQMLIHESGRIVADITQNLMEVDPWAKKVTQKPFPKGMGLSVKKMIVHPVIPVDPVYTPMVVTDDDGDPTSCNPPTTKLRGPGQSLLDLSMGQIAYESPELCIFDLENAANPEEVLQFHVDDMKRQTAWIWGRTHITQITQRAGRKIVATVDGSGEMPSSPTAFNLGAANSILTAAMMDRFHQWFIDAGGRVARRDSANNLPVFDAYFSSAASQTVVKTDPSIRRDFQESSRVDQLIDNPRIFDGKTINGWKHHILNYPLRWNFTSGAWVHVPPFDNGVSVTKGYEQEVTTEYQTASHEDSIFIATDDAYEVYIPSNRRKIGPMGFDPNSPNYVGDFSWVNIQDNLCNKFGDTGHFLARIIQGPWVGLPKFIIVCRHLRPRFVVRAVLPTFDVACPCPAQNYVPEG